LSRLLVWLSRTAVATLPCAWVDNNSRTLCQTVHSSSDASDCRSMVLLCHSSTHHFQVSMYQVYSR
jgi:hypothetical protein